MGNNKKINDFKVRIWTLLVGGWVFWGASYFILEYFYFKMQKTTPSQLVILTWVVWAIPVSFGTFTGVVRILNRKMDKNKSLLKKILAIGLWVIFMGIQVIIFIYGYLAIVLGIRGI